MEDDLRRTFQPDEPTIVGALVDTAPPHTMWVYLVRQAGKAEYHRVAAWYPVGPGDDCVVYLLDPTRLDRLQRLNEMYSDTWYVRPDWYDAPWPDELVAFDTWVPRSGADVLEICCGAGRSAPALVRDGNRVVGLDLAAPSLEKARSVAPKGLTYVRGDATALPFADGAFDVAMCLENSLGEFLVDPMPPLVEMVRVTRAGGRVLAALRAAEDPWVSWSPDGYVHVVRCFPEERRQWFVGECLKNPRVARVEVHPAAERPWGGRVWYAVLGIT